MWFNRVKLLSKGCRFGGHIESILVDRFITGLNQTLLERFYNEMDQVFSLDKAFNMAIEWERNCEPCGVRYPDNRRRYQNNKKKPGEEFEIIDGKKTNEKKMNNFDVSGSKNINNPFLGENKNANCYNEYKVDNLFKSKNTNASNFHVPNKYSWKAGGSQDQVDSGFKNTNPFKTDSFDQVKQKPQRAEQRSRSAPRHCQPNNPGRYAGHNQRQYEEYQDEEYPVEYEYVAQNQRKRNNKPRPKKEEDSCVLC